MEWRVVESFRKGKSPNPELCEDIVISNEQGLHAVIDGSTDKSGRSYFLDGKEVISGKFAAHTVARVFQGVPADATPEEVVAYMSAVLDKKIREQHPDIALYERPACVITVFNPLARQIWWVGDGQFAYKLNHGRIVVNRTETATDQILVPMRRLIHESLAAAGTPWSPDSGTPDPGRKALMPVLNVEGIFINSTGPWGFGRLNGTVVPEQFIGKAKLPDSAQEVVLATDGYPELAIDGELSLKKAEERLAVLLAEDPLCIGRLASTKGLQAGNLSFDDRAWLKLELQPSDE